MQIIINNGMQSKCRVTIFCILNVKVEEINIISSFNTVFKLTNLKSGRLTVTRITTENVAFIMLNIYASNNAQSHRGLFRILTALIRQLADLYILTDDWNNVLNPELDRASLANQQQDSLRELLIDLINISGSVDAFRVSHSLNRFYIFKRGKRIISCLNKI
jgi:hypothetical protein